MNRYINGFFTVFKFEYLGYMKSKSYIAITVILVTLALAAPCVPTVLGLINKSKDGSEATEANTKLAAIIDNTELFLSGSIESGFNGYNFTELDKSDALDSLSSGDLDFVMEITDAVSFELYVGKMNIMRFDLMSLAGSALRAANEKLFLESKGLTPEEIESFRNMNINGDIKTINVGEEEEQDSSAYVQKIVYAYVLLFVLYFTLLMYGQYIVISIVSEKSSKAMELLVTSTKPMNLMFGKVLGVGAAGLTQFILMGACAFVSFSINSMLWVSLEISDFGGLSSTISSFMSPVSPSIFVYLTIFFILGFFAYAFLYAGFASTASRIEEANTVSAVPMMLIIFSFLIAMIGLTNPGSTMVTVASYIPFMSPMVMFMRICTGSAGNTGAIISILILTLSIFAAAYLSAKIYRIGILMYGKPLKPVDILKMFFRAKV